MARRKEGATSGSDGQHRFGGDWTTTKLEILERYLEAYTTALKKQPFKTAYIDAFAGTGYRNLRQTNEDPTLQFPDLAEEAPQSLLEGSARVALRVVPRFHRYIFIEKDGDHCQQLEKLRDEFPDLRQSITIQQGDANKEIRRICQKNWDNHRAVLFLDPYGMQVEWETIERVAATGAIDLWLLFPLGMGVNRLLPRSGQIPEGWRNRLNVFLGSEDWYRSFYHEETSRTLFGEETIVIKEGIEDIGRYFVERLRTVFRGVSSKPRILTNSTHCPLYLLCFAVNSPNEKARGIALRIANHLIERV